MFRLFSFIAIVLSGIAIHAQSPQYSIFDKLEGPPKANEGLIVIHQSDGVRRLVGTRIDSENIDILNGESYLKTRGYRVQVYSGNNQRVSKDEAEKLKKTLQDMYPGIKTYQSFTAPFWKLQVGNYLTYEEAYVMLRELRKAFPQRKNEINIFEEEIQLLLE